MKAYDYSGLTEVAQNLIQRFGRVVYKRVAEDTGFSKKYAPKTRYVDTPITAVSLAYKPFEIDGTLIKGTDKKLLTYTAIDIDDMILDNNIQYSVISLDIVNPGDTTLIYKAQLRK